MGKIWEFFEHLDEYVYVSDPETNQLVYMNQKALKSYGFQSKEEIVGLKCYEVLQRNSAPCSICNNEQLRPGYFKEWEYYNPVVKTDFRIKDTLVEDDGRMLRMEIAIDCGHSGDRETSMDYHEMEAAMNQAIRVALRQETPNQTLEVLLELLGKTMEADRTYIFEKNDHGHDDNTYEWAARGVIPEKDNLQDLPPEVCDQWYQKFAGNQNIVTENLSEIRDTDPEMYEVLSRQNIHSLVVVPLYDDEKVIGFYGVDNPPAKYIDFASEILQIMGHFIVSSIRRRNLVRRLEIMSYTDPLTGFGNRYAMVKYVSGILPQTKIGVAETRLFMTFFEEFFSNHIFLTAACGWFVAQILKTLIHLIISKKFVAERLVGSGGMPSSHSATVCALVTATCYEYGAGSFEFAISDQ